MKKINYYRQDDNQSCGSYCLLMILDYYHRLDEIKNIKRRAHQTVEGVTVANMVKTLKHYNLEAKAYFANLEQMTNEAALPAIVLTTQAQVNHYMVVFKQSQTEFLLGDPAQGKVKMSRSQFEKIYGQVVIIIEHAGRSDDNERPEKLGDHLKANFRANWPLIGKIAVASLIIALATLVVSAYYQQVFVTLMGSSMIIALASLLGVVTLLKGVVEYSRQTLMIELTTRLQHKYLLNTSKDLVYLGNYQYGQLQNGATLAQLTSLSSLGEILSSICGVVAFDLILAVLLIGALGVVTPWLAGGFVVMFSGLGGFLYHQKKRLLQVEKSYRDSYEELVEAQLELLNNFPRLKQYRLNRLIKAKVNYRFVGYLSHFQERARLGAGLAIVVETGTSLGILALIASSQLLGVSNDRVILVYLLFSFATAPVLNLINAAINFEQLQIVFAKYRQLTPDAPERVKDLREKITSVEFCNVTAGYFQAPVVSNLSFKITKGTVIEGQVGSGKTTLCKLLLRQLEIDAGEILINGCSLNEYSSRSLARKIQYLGAKPVFLQETLRYNLLLGQADQEDRCLELLERFHQGELVDYFDYPLDHNFLSAGMSQLVMLIRTLLLPFDVLLLDEAISNLDPETTQEILSYLRVQPFITVIITHHTNLVNFQDGCDRIVLK